MPETPDVTTPIPTLVKDIPDIITAQELRDILIDMGLSLKKLLTRIEKWGFVLF